MKFSSFHLLNWYCLSSKNIHASSVTAHIEQTIVYTSLLTLSNQELDDCFFFYCTSVCYVRINCSLPSVELFGKCLRIIKDFTDVDISIKEECKETKNRLFFVTVLIRCFKNLVYVSVISEEWYSIAI